jgi:SAM-dependent methyltransferase
MPGPFDGARNARAFAGAIDAFAQVPLLRAGLRTGLFDALRQPHAAGPLAERLGLAPDLVAAWARLLHSLGWLQKRGEEYRIGPTIAWLLDSQDAASLAALLDQSVETIAPRLSALPELMKGAERPTFGSRDDALRMAAVTRLVAGRALRVLEKIPGARHPRRILDIGCGQGHYLAELLSRYRDALGIGIELDPRVAEAARQRLSEADVTRRAEIRVGDFLAMEPPPGRFDLILLNHNLHYFTPAQRVVLLRRARGLLDEEGALAVQTLVLTEGLLPSLLGLQAGTALFDLVLRTHANLHGLPAIDELHRALHEAGLPRTGEVPIVPGGAVRFVWGSPHGADGDGP